MLSLHNFTVKTVLCLKVVSWTSPLIFHQSLKLLYIQERCGEAKPRTYFKNVQYVHILKMCNSFLHAQNLKELWEPSHALVVVLI